METGFAQWIAGIIKGLRDPSIQITIIPTVGPKICEYYLHWAIWIPRDRLNRPETLNQFESESCERYA